VWLGRSISRFRVKLSPPFTRKLKATGISLSQLNVYRTTRTRKRYYSKERQNLRNCRLYTWEITFVGLTAMGYIKAGNVHSIDNCDMPRARGWLLLMIITKSSQENVNIEGVPYLILREKIPAPEPSNILVYRFVFPF